MGNIRLLDKDTINKIAAGEVVDRPQSVVKELIENAIDAGAGIITCEIKDGGKSYIRITDNGGGFEKDDIKIAFLRHTTSKIKNGNDLDCIRSLGFRGEALSSISAVSKLELLTKRPEDFLGSRYVTCGGEEKAFEEAGCPDGTSIIVRELFYNTPARRKFLKSNITEASYINDTVSRLAISHPEISFRFINQGRTMIFTNGNGKEIDTLYSIYGKELASNLIRIDHEDEFFNVHGYIGKPVTLRGNRISENYYINGRYSKAAVITKSIEEAYKGYAMNHKYPFTSLHFEFPLDKLDINVHPAKMEVRIADGEFYYAKIFSLVSNALHNANMIVDAEFGKEQGSAGNESQKQERISSIPQSFEQKRLEKMAGNALETAALARTMFAERNGLYRNAGNGGKDSSAFGRNENESGIFEKQNENRSYTADEILRETAGREYNHKYDETVFNVNTELSEEKPQSAVLNEAEGKITPSCPENTDTVNVAEKVYNDTANKVLNNTDENPGGIKNIIQTILPESGLAQKIIPETGEIVYEQLSFTDKEEFMKDSEFEKFRIVGQVFGTFWILEMEGSMLMIDQHAAHEKILYERTMKRYREGRCEAQQLMPAIVLSLSLAEAETLERYKDYLNGLGFEIEHFGGKEYRINAVPVDLFGFGSEEFFREVLDSLMESPLKGEIDIVTDRIATMSCKAAIKGNTRISEAEARELIKELLKLENPYHCPHGRPVIITMSRYEIEKKFKRIL